MNKMKLWLLDKMFGKELRKNMFGQGLSDAGSNSNSAATTGAIAGTVTAVGMHIGDTTSTDYEDAEYDFSTISTAYDTDSYIRQGVDKYVDQIFKEGWTISGKNSDVVEYVNLRLAYIAEATKVPTSQLLIEIAEDVVKYSNCIITKVRSNDAAVLPPGVSVTGVNGGEPVAGYFCVNVSTITAKRDQYGTIEGWQQEVDGASDKIEFDPNDIVHIYYKREKGNVFGTPLLTPVLDDVRALRQAEENVLKMMYRNIHPFYHIAVGDSDKAGTPTEVAELQAALESMDVDGGMVTTNRVAIKAIASNQVVSADPYLSYLEARVFTGLGVPAVMFGRGDTANRNTSDNMTSEMSDRIKAIQRTIEMFINSFIIRELLLEGGYDPVVNPEHVVEFQFKENDLDLKIKNETHAVYLYEHNSIDEDEMRKEIGRDPITDRAKMHQMIITKVNSTFGKDSTSSNENKEEETGNKETDNKNQPENQHGKKTSSKKTTNNEELFKGLLVDILDEAYSDICIAIDTKNYEKVTKTLNFITFNLKLFKEELQIEDSDRYIVGVDGYISDLIENVTGAINDFSNVQHSKAIISANFDIAKEAVYKCERRNNGNV